MQKMIGLLVMVLGGVSFNIAHASEMTFEQRKAEALKRVDERIKMMQQHRDCMEKTVDTEAFKKCHETMRNWRDDHRAEFRERMKKHPEQKK